MKYLKSFNESVGISADEMDNINDICLDLIDLGLQYRIISSTMDGESLTGHLFVDYNQQTSMHSKSGIYNDMMIEIYDKYDISSGAGSDSGDIKITEELIDIIMRLDEYLDSDLRFGAFYQNSAFNVDYTEMGVCDLDINLEKLENISEFDSGYFKISQIDIKTKKTRPPIRISSGYYTESKVESPQFGLVRFTERKQHLFSDTHLNQNFRNTEKSELRRDLDDICIEFIDNDVDYEIKEGYFIPFYINIDTINMRDEVDRSGSLDLPEWFGEVVRRLDAYMTTLGYELFISVATASFQNKWADMKSIDELMNCHSHSFNIRLRFKI